MVDPGRLTLRCTVQEHVHERYASKYIHLWHVFQRRSSIGDGANS